MRRQLGLPLGLGALVVVALLAPRWARTLPSAPRQMSSESGSPRPSPPSPPPGGALVPAGARPQPRLAVPPGVPSVPGRPLDPTRGASVPDPRKQRGVSLGLFAEDVSFDYAPLLREIAALGATHVQLVVPVYQEHAASTELGLHTRLSPGLSATAEAIRAARREGLEVLLFPIVRLAAPRGPNEWRGTLRPASRDAWFASYGEVLGDLAALATMTGATRLAVGSELSSLDGDLERWRPLLERIRALFPGTLVYSANWDHYRKAPLLDLVDEAGVVAYFELRARDGPSDVPALEKRWRELQAELVAWRAGRPQPFVFTEVGYRSRRGATAAPWDEGGGGEPDLDEQRRAFAAFRNVWAGGAAPIPGFGGVYVWNWYGFGGPNTRGYTPRGKPAAAEVQALLERL